jgi:hypothetical protein
MMKRIALVLVLAAACKDGSKDAPAPPAPAAPAHASPAPAGPRPALADQGSATATPDTPRPALANDGSGAGSDRVARRHERLQSLHDKLDANSDGKLTPDELANAQPGPGRRAMRFDNPAALDTNHDGDISVDELEAGMKARRDLWRARRDGSGGGGGNEPTE